jgi:tetratricopeptide (TPR) repeat protein/predicted Ser/Thr protein kinase
MKPDRFARLKEILADISDLSEDERRAYLDKAFKDDPELRQEVESILAHESDRHDLLRTGGAISFTGEGSTEPVDMTGHTLSRFRIEEKIATGGMGVLYKAVDTDLGRDVAIKVLRPDLLHDPDSRKRFIREAQAASVLDHPGIVTVYEIGADSDIDFIVMEYVEGCTLNEMIPPKGMPLDRVVSYAIAMADTLKVAHEKGIVHRDLKPSNIMITNDDSVKILDFGIAKRLSAETGDGTTEQPETEITQKGSIIGTIGYMSPEQAIGARIDERSDIFSLGVVIYQLLTGTHPFEGDHAGSVIHAILHSDPLRVEELKEGVPEEVERVVFKALQKKPRDRYRSSAELKTDLESLVDILKGKSLELIATKEVFEEGSGGIYSAMVGREVELEILEGHLGKMLKGEGTTVMIRGEAGIGKSRLVWELGRIAKKEKVRYLVGRCLSRGEDIPYQPVFDVIRTYLGLKGIKDAIGLEHFIGERAPHLKGRLGVIRAFSFMEGEEETSLISKEQLWNTVMELVKVMSGDRPVLLHMEDLHWADVPTLNLLTYLARNTRRERVLIVGTYRPEELAEGHEEKVHPLVTTLKQMNNEKLYELVNLNRLDRDATRGVIDSAFTEAEFPESFIDRIYEETEGNPLFIMEVLKHLRHEGVITRANGGWKLSTRVTSIEVPGRVNDVIVNRLSSLSRGERDIVEVASVEGQAFRSATVCHCLGLRRIKVLRRLQDLEDSHHLIHASKEDYHFDHVQIREVIYGGLIPELRMEYHKRIGEHLRKRYDKADEYAGKIAYHLRRAGEEKEAIPYFLKAGEHAKKTFANEEAIGYFDEGIEIVDKHILQNSAPDLQRMKLDMYKGRAEVRKLIGQYNEAQSDYRCVEEITRDLGDEKKRASGLDGLGEILYRKGDYEVALEHFMEALEIFREIGDRPGEGTSLSHVGVVHYARGDYEEALEYLEEALEIKRETGDRLGEGATLGNIGIVRYLCGDYEEALKHYEEGLEIFREIGNRSAEGTALLNIGNVYHARGDYEEALEYLMEELEISREMGDKFGEGNSLSNIGNVCYARGDYEEALEYLMEALEIMREIGERMGHLNSQRKLFGLWLDIGDYEKVLSGLEKTRQLAEALGTSKAKVGSKFDAGYENLVRGFYEEAIKDVKNGLEMALEIDHIGTIMEGHHLATQIEFKRENYLEALEYAEGALNLATEKERKKDIAKSHLLLARIHGSNGNLKEAESSARQVLTIAEACGMKPLLWQAHHVLGRALLKQKQVPSAKKELEKAEKIVNEIASRLTNELKKTYLAKEEIKDLYEDLSAVEIDSSNCPKRS